MSQPSKAPMDCESVRIELPALLYGELDGETRVRVERHVASCRSCRTELDGHRQTLAKLDEWTVERAPIPSNIRTPEAAAPNRFRWTRPVAVGVAAASLAFAALSLIGAGVQYTDGQLVLTLGSPTAIVTPEPNSFDGARLIPAMQTVARNEVDVRIDTLLRLLDQELSDLTAREEARRLLLVRAMDARRDSDLLRLTSIVETLAVRQDDVFDAWVNRNPNAAHIDADERKEKP